MKSTGSHIYPLFPTVFKTLWLFFSVGSEVCNTQENPQICLITLSPAKYERGKEAFWSFILPKGKEKSIHQEPPITRDVMTLERN